MANLCAKVFALIGGVLMLGALVVCLFSLDAPAQMLGKPKAAMACSEELMQKLSAGEFQEASRLMYGQPQLGGETSSEDVYSAMVWDAFVRSISYEFVGVCYVEDGGICRDVSITTLDIPTVTENLQTRVQVLLKAAQSEMEDPDAAYDAQGNVRAELADQLLQEAMQKALKEDAKTVTREVTLKLIHKDGQWWVSADTALLEAISGGLA